MVATGNHEEIEILVRLNEGVGETQSGFGWDVVVRLADNQEQLALQPPGVVYVGTLGIPILRFFAPDFVQRQVTHPLLVPRRFVEAIVVTSAGRDRRLVKL